MVVHTFHMKCSAVEYIKVFNVLAYISFTVYYGNSAFAIMNFLRNRFKKRVFFSLCLLFADNLKINHGACFAQRWNMINISYVKKYPVSYLLIYKSFASILQRITLTYNLLKLLRYLLQHSVLSDSFVSIHL